ncbi:hypothetical protein HPB50_018794 [Hyalomma asiaticum]|uniref:Uncharacterized protein n=1 Tax=Hyalomma asiaticum TaxID=266040 RepID=A0ACB7RLM0_HYAAI|nr:hypothetical protein HPB50_018794 [Hyalomma asiaticum]
MQGCIKEVKTMSFASAADAPNLKAEERVLNVNAKPGVPERSRIAVKPENRVPEQSALVLAGDNVEVPTLTGSNITLPLRGVARSGSIIRIQSYGLPDLLNPTKRGELFVVLDVLSRPT